MPGDKSISHRSLLLGALAEGVTEITGMLEGDDCLCTRNAVEALGVSVQVLGTGHYRVHGAGLQGLREPDSILDMGNSGTGIRLLAGVLAGQPFLSVMTGDASLRSRPMKRIAEPLRRMGAFIDGRDGGNKAPLVIRGGELKGIRHISDKASAQVKSAILLAGLNASGETEVSEPGLSRDHTERMLKAFGVHLECANNTVRLQGHQTLHARPIHVPGDFSSAAFFIAAAILVPDSDISLSNVGLNPTRTGLLDALASMSATQAQITPAITDPVEETGSIRVKSTPLKASCIGGDLVVRMIDEFPIFSILAACAEGTTTIRDASELRVKESDRIAVMARELQKMGVEVREQSDGMQLVGADCLKGAVVKSYGDHRVAMSLAVAALRAKGETTIENTDCIATSFPDFVNLMRQLGADIEEQECQAS